MSPEALALFTEWFCDAQNKVNLYPEAMTLSTVSPEGRPSSRTVLLKNYDEHGFVFYTNKSSRKGIELAVNKIGALQFYWRESRRQIRIEGSIVQVNDSEADAYFASRDRMSQIGAWASKQSQVCTPMGFRARIAKKTFDFGVLPVPRPSFWTGFRLKPDYFEFWEEKPFRWHDRRVYRKSNGQSWTQYNLYP